MTRGLIKAERLMMLVLEDSKALFQPCALLTDASSEVGFYSFLYSRNRKPKAIVRRHFKLKLQEQVTQRLPHTSSYRSQADVTAGCSDLYYSVFGALREDCRKIQGRNISGGLRWLQIIDLVQLCCIQCNLN